MIDPKATIKMLEAMQELTPAWFPQFGNVPQNMAFESEAQVIFYGGAAGGGKSELIIGKTLMHGKNCIIFRRTYPQFERFIQRFGEIVGAHRVVGGKMVRPETGKRGISAEWIKLAHIQHEKDTDSYQGGERDIMCFDELPQFSRAMFTKLMAWSRTTRKDKNGKPRKTQVIAAGNPPVSPEGLWVIDQWGPWLDKRNEHYPTPSGAILWRCDIEGEVFWMKSGRKVTKHPKTGDKLKRAAYPVSYTFIRATVDDNPELRDNAEYRGNLDGMPIEIRAAYRDGDFQASLLDQPFQIIPLDAYSRGVDRWREGKAEGQQTVLGIDVARGGADRTCISVWYGKRCETIHAYPGTSTRNGDAVIEKVINVQDRPGVPIAIDIIGVGASVYDTAVKVLPNVYRYSAAGSSHGADKSGQLQFLNKNAEDWWKLREDLIATDSKTEIPDNSDLFRQLTGRLWKISDTGKIQIESKEDYRARTGESPDLADAFIIGHAQGRAMAAGVINWG